MIIENAPRVLQADGTVRQLIAVSDPAIQGVPAARARRIRERDPTLIWTNAFGVQIAAPRPLIEQDQRPIQRPEVASAVSDIHHDYFL